MEKPAFYKYFIYAGTAFIALFVLYYFLMAPPRDFPQDKIIEIKEGASLRGVSLALKDARIIRSRAVFEAFVIFFGGEKKVRPGDYLFEEKIPVYLAARRVARGESHTGPVKVTIPEGYTNAEIEAILKIKLKNFDSDKFRDLAEGKEGYLFPDTYFFLSTDREDTAVRLFSGNYEKKIAPLRGAISVFGRTEREIITMASIIEGEADGEKDRELISGILWRREKIGMPLQADTALIT